jgi:hypothetical protein
MMNKFLVSFDTPDAAARFVDAMSTMKNGSGITLKLLDDSLPAAGKELIELSLEVDTNDADYRRVSHAITAEQLDRLRPLLAAIANFVSYESVIDGSEWHHDHNYPLGGDYPRDDLGEKFPQDIYPNIDQELFNELQELLPCEAEGFHSITSVKVRKLLVEAEEQLV